MKDLTKKKPITSLICSLVFTFLLVFNLTARGQAISGTVTIGPSGNYPSLTSAFAYLNSNGVNGPLVMELLSTYTGSGETFPLMVNSITGASPSQTITVRPETGATGLIISSNAINTINMLGARHVIFDGRPGGIGTIPELRISNTGSSNISVSFSGDATKNTFRYCTIAGANALLTSGVISFGVGTVTGNDSNTIEYCHIRDTATSPAYMIYSAGSTSNAGIYNSDNVIRNCTITGFGGALAECGAVKLNGGNSSWTFTNNHIYQAVTMAGSAAQIVYGINMNATANNTGNAHVITNNFIGGSEPFCAGNAWTVNSTGNLTFKGIDLCVGAVSPALVRNNTISNFNWNSASGTSGNYGRWCGIWLTAGAATITENTIGSTTAYESIVVSSTVTGNFTYGIGTHTTAASSIINITNNRIGGIRTSGNAPAITASFVGLYVSGSSAPTTVFNITGNLVGNGLADNIYASNAASSIQVLYGIHNNASATTALFNITGNRISGLRNNVTSTSAGQGQTIGIRSGAGENNISNDTIINLVSASPQAGVTLNAAITGIMMTSAADAPHRISGNLIYGLSSTAAATAVQITGIYYAGTSPSGLATISGNLIHSFSAVSSVNTTAFTGIEAQAGASGYYNNMIRLGIDKTGAPVLSGYAIKGINENGGINQFAFNSVYIGGTGVTASSSTYAFYSGLTPAGSRSIVNNIFANNRSDLAAGASANAGIGLVSLSNTVCNTNLYHTPGTAGKTGSLAGVSYTTMADWKTAAVPADGSSASASPNFINATGDSSAVNLHVQSPTPVERNGLPFTDLASDFDGQARSSLSPVDIGADAGSFSGPDIFSPFISLTELPNTFSTADITLTATIMDGTGGDPSGALRPKLYFKKNSAVSYASATGTLTSGNGKNGSWNFTLTGASVGGFVAGDTIVYVLVAQDTFSTPNIGSFPAGAVASSVNSVSSFPSPKSYRILAPVSGIKTIGTGGNYPNLNTAFEDLYLNGISGAVTMNLLSSYNSSAEVFPITLKTIAGASAANRITVRPATGATGLSISSNALTTLAMDGAQFVTFDGRAGGAGASQLTIENTSTTGVTLRLINDAISNIFTYTTFKAVAVNNGISVIYFGTTTGPLGNDSNTISFCNITSGATFASIGISSFGTAASATNCNSGNIITSNRFYDIWPNGIEGVFIKLPTNGGGQRWTITDNHFYYTRALATTATTAIQAIRVGEGGGHTITGNYIGGTAPMCGGAAVFLNSTHNARYTAISLDLSEDRSVIANNTITNFDWKVNVTQGATAGGMWSAIAIGKGLADIKNNTIGKTTSNNALVLNNGSNNSFALGILSTSATPGLMVISNNKIGGFTLNTTASTLALNFTGIYLGGTAPAEAEGIQYNVDSNEIGGNITDNIISLRQTTIAQVVVGIQNSVAAYSPFGPILSGGVIDAVPVVNHVFFVARNNVIRSLRNYHAGTTLGQTIGIRSTTGVNHIRDNTIYNITNKSPQAGTGVAAPVIGISQASAAAAMQNISGNRIYNLFSDSVMTLPVNVTGIVYAGIASGTNTVSGNFIHHLFAAGSSSNNVLTGIHAVTGNTIFSNNMISIGSDTAGSPLNNMIMYGMREDAGTNHFYHNSVHIGNDLSTNPVNTYSLYSTATPLSPRNIQNNIFSNRRLSGPGKHYCISFASTANQVCNNNLFDFPAATFNFAGAIGVTDYATLSQWTTGTTLDKTSISYPSGFIAADANTASTDLHINTSIATPLESGGLTIPEVTYDFDGHLRDTLSPVDIGADAGKFLLLDMSPPNIANVIIGNTNDTIARTFSLKITDGSGVYISGINIPQIYYRKGAGATTFVRSAATFVSGTAQNGTWSFTIDPALLPGGVFNRNDSVYYFIVAQDSSGNNITSAPAGVTAADVYNVTEPPLSLYSFRIMAPVWGTHLVGTGQATQNLTSSDGMFAFMQQNGITGDVTLKITSDLSETGVFAFPQTPYKITIVPATNTVMNIVGDNVSAPLFRFSGSRNIKIDGSFNGTGRFLRFLNTNINRPTFGFLKDSRRDTITSCIIEGGNTSSYSVGSAQQIGVISFNEALATGNDSNCVSYCYITGGPGQTPSFLVASTGPTTAGMENSENSILYNEFVNQGVYGFQLAAGTGENWNISYNSFYRTTPATNLQYAMQIYNGDAYTISYNSFGGSAPDRSGAPYQGASSMYFLNMTNTASLNKVSNVSNNYISNVSVTAANQTFNAFLMGAKKVNLSSNIIGGGAMPYDTIATGGGSQTDMIIYNSAASEISITNNTIGNIAFHGVALPRMSAIYINAAAANGIISGNTIRNIISNSGTITEYNAGIILNGPTGFTIENNTIHSITNVNMVVANSLIAGIHVNAGSSCRILRNRIYNIGSLSPSPSLSSPQVFGIRVNTANNTIAGNQISIGMSAKSDPRISGIYDVSTSGNSNIYYNSIFINGVSEGDNNSYGILRSAASSVNMRNNLIYNKRTSTGMAKAYAIGGESPLNIGYMFAAVTDTSAIAEFPASSSLSWNAFSSAYTLIPNSSWAETVSALPAESLFTDTATGNLNINTANESSWYVNGKGIAISGFSGDHGAASGVRSESIAAGGTDIGADEFSTVTLPPQAVAVNPVSQGLTTDFVFAGRKVASVTWGPSGTLPSAFSVRYFSGINPPSAIAGRTYMNAYWDITPNAGSGYTYSLSLLNDSALYGTVGSSAALKAARYTGTGPLWNSLSTSVNNTAGTFTASGLAAASWGIFTGTDALNNPLPVSLLSFTAARKGHDAELSWSTASESDNAGFIIERSYDAKSWHEAGFVNGVGNTRSRSLYTYTDKDPFGSSSILYYRLQQVDNNGARSASAIAAVSNSAATGLSIYPVPFADHLYADHDVLISEITITDIAGKTVIHENVNSSHAEVKGADLLKTGIYFMSVKDINGAVSVTRIIRQ